MQQRRLAVIMFTDIVGYTALMGRDEQKALSLLRKNRKIHRRLIQKNHGRLLKEMGDGMLAIFPSCTDAVVAAISIQKIAVKVSLQLRIGIHEGDVIFEDKDVLGDGVNIASRIQDLAPVNGIHVSEPVYRQIKNKKGLESEFIGSQTLKGVDGSTDIYRVWSEIDTVLDFSVEMGESVNRWKLFLMGAGGIIVILLIA